MLALIDEIPRTALKNNKNQRERNRTWWESERKTPAVEFAGASSIGGVRRSFFNRWSLQELLQSVEFAGASSIGGNENQREYEETSGWGFAEKIGKED